MPGAQRLELGGERPVDQRRIRQTRFGRLAQLGAGLEKPVVGGAQGLQVGVKPRIALPGRGPGLLKLAPALLAFPFETVGPLLEPRALAARLLELALQSRGVGAAVPGALQGGVDPLVHALERRAHALWQFVCLAHLSPPRLLAANRRIGFRGALYTIAGGFRTRFWLPACDFRRDWYARRKQARVTGKAALEMDEIRAAHPEHWLKATAIRALALDAVHAANSGHSGMPIGMADVATVLFERHLKFDAAAPDWPDRDRLILSAGHGSMLLYALLHLTGSPGMTLEQIRNFRQLGALTAGHPENFLHPGIETTTGPLGQGLANAVGLAMAEEMLRARFGRKAVDHRTYAIAGDGCLMEGISQEAIALAGRHRLGKLIVLWDDNRVTIDGAVDLADRTDQAARFRACGWHVAEAEGHDPDSVDAALREAAASQLPSMIACRTRIAIGHAAEGTARGHGALTDPEELKAAKDAWGWSGGPFEIPAKVKSAWEEIGRRGAAERAAWEARVAAMGSRRRAEFDRVTSGAPHPRLPAVIRSLKKRISAEAPKVATRKSSEMVLDAVNPIMRETVGGSADLTGSNNTRSGDMTVFDVGNRGGRYVHYGVREHAMAAAMNGMALHGGLRPYGGTFMCFTDYARPAMRLAALMRIPTVFVMTHDSIGLGEDGPTHQPVEHLAISRATPNTLVFRPCDTVETAESWQLALESTSTPSVLSLTRQSAPTLRTRHATSNLTARGAYVLAEAEGRRRAILLATGSEVQVALKARDLLQAQGVGTRVVSMPCWELFERQDERYRRRVLPPGTAVRVAVEAASRLGWDRWLCGERGREARSAFVGMETFGASAPSDALFEHFGITAEAVAERALALL